MTVNDELERMWKEAVVVCFKISSRNLPGGAKESNHLRIANLWAKI
jgi:hypothetical protein